MARKGGTRGPPENRQQEQQWQPTETNRIVRRADDKAVDIEIAEEDFAFIYGDVVHDAEDDEREDSLQFVVVNTPDITAMEWEYEDRTLADRNPGYPTDDDVVVCVEREILDDYLPEWDEREEDLPLEQLRNDEIECFVAPSLRLVLVEESHLRE